MKKKGFTLVEVLICIGIIGIIAAISIPALLTSTSSKALEAQRKALHSRMAQAFAQFNNLRLYETTPDNSATDFITTGLSGVLKLSAICNSQDLSECNIPASVDDYYSDVLPPHNFSISSANSLYKLNPDLNTEELWDEVDTSVAGFKTANGESVLLYYNPRCKSKKEIQHKLTESVCVNMIYDLNGSNKAPNAYGEDIGFITVFYPSDSSVVAPVVYNKQSYVGTFAEMFETANSNNLLSPTLEELTSILINKQLVQIVSSAAGSDVFWSNSYSSTGSSTEAWTASIALGSDLDVTTESHGYFLIKK